MFYLELWTERNEKAGLLVPHDYQPWLDGHHQVNTHFLYISRENIDVSFYHLETVILKMEFIILYTSRLQSKQKPQKMLNTAQTLCETFYFSLYIVCSTCQRLAGYMFFPTPCILIHNMLKTLQINCVFWWKIRTMLRCGGGIFAAGCHAVRISTLCPAVGRY